MDPTNEEILRFMQEWLDITEHKLAARYDRMIQVIDSCLTTGCATTSSSTSVGNDVCGVAEVSTPASPNPVAEVPTPAYSDSDVNLVTVDAADPADPTRTTHWTRDSSRDTTESRSAPAPTTAPTVHTATVDIIPVLTAAAASDGTFGGQAISGVASTLATCSMVCLHQHQVTDPALVATSLPTPAEFVLDTNDDTSSLDTNGIPATAVPLAIAGVLPAVSEMVISALTVQAQQLYNSSELFRPGYSLHIINIVPVHRPIPWPSFTGVHADGNKAPAFKGINDCESSSDAIMKPSRRYTCDSFLQTIGNVVEFQIQDCYGNLCTSTSSITIHDMCSASELKCWNDVLLFFEYWWSIRNYVQSVHTTLVGPPCFIPGSPLWVIVRSFKLKLFSNGYAPITLLVVLLDSGTFAAFGCEYLGVDIIDCIGSSLLAGCSLVVCQKSSVRSSTHYLIASESVSRLLCTLDWQLLDSHCRAAVKVCLSCAQEPDHYFCSSVLKELLVLKLMRSSSNYVLCDEWVLSPWDPGQAVISDFANVFYSQANFGMYPKKLMLQSLKVSGSNGHFVIKRYPPNKVVMPCFICEPLPMEKTMLYAAKCCIPSSDSLQEAMKLTAMSVPWQYFSQAELNDSGNSISICRRLDSELESISVVPFLSVSCDTTVHDMLSKMEYMIFIVSACSSCLNDGVIYTPWICVAGPTLITLHKPQTPVQGMSRELLIREPYGRYCCSALFSLDLHRILSLNGSGIPSHVVLLSFCGKPHGIGCLWQGSIHAEVTFWLDYSFIRISKMPQTRQSPHAHCSTGLQIGISVPKCFLCQLFLVMAPLISLLEKQLLPTWPRPNAYCLITNTMFWDAYLSSMIIYKEWRQTHYGIIIHICELPGVKSRGVLLEQNSEPSVVFRQSSVQMQIGWPPCAQVGFFTIKRGMLWLLVDMRIPSSPTSTGNLSDAEQCDSALDCKESQKSWNRGMSQWDVFVTASISRTGRQMTGLDRHVVLRLPWDPGIAAAAWGQAAFQGGRGVRDPSYTTSWAGTWAIVMGLAYYRKPATELHIQKAHQRGGHPSWITTKRFSPGPLLLCFPVLAPLFFPKSLLKSLYPDLCVVNPLEP